MTFNLFAEIERVTEEFYPTTFADIELGEEFVDEHGITWEKRTEKSALSWLEFEPPEWVNFLPDEPVRRK